ncbi:RNA methyltransferase [Desulfovibrio ferrophilus]|uniref:tRNA/rRNA methyltransferase SpoU n=1 Tax=Desulfovibrio ferrophilus TaxID=241368 RepID=A0A2Z6B2U5_9BACT|nr:RNA methyltransferase [Desulfovibrio ferrophilus]BBD09811.1 tRNA/rRNA methyltransferase SpoU [Desulfovibrio ferrophilus]
MLDNLTIVLFNPKFPENIGSAARACVNMGCANIIAVTPRNWNLDKAALLATTKGAEILRNMRIENDLPTALAGFSHVYGTTARIGGWRKGLLSPAKAAVKINEQRAQGGIAIVFGPEDRGLTNAETEICHDLITIPTVPEASSLNLAQAVLVVLYECFARSMESRSSAPPQPSASNLTTHEEQELLFGTMQETLLCIDYIKQDNSDYWMLPIRRFLTRSPLKRLEFNMLMGVCRQVKWIADKARGQALPETNTPSDDSK